MSNLRNAHVALSILGVEGHPCICIDRGPKPILYWPSIAKEQDALNKPRPNEMT